jgi:hypothetical protein
MNLKTEITKHILETMGLEANDARVRKTIPTWWYSTRQKEKGGLRLTEQGFEAFQKAGIKDYRVKFEDTIHFTNQLIIWLDQFIDCPFYLRNKEIYVFNEKIAVQLVLFSGNIQKYTSAKVMSQSA